MGDLGVFLGILCENDDKMGVFYVNFDKNGGGLCEK